jgi:hypothetical protein
MFTSRDRLKCQELGEAFFELLTSRAALSRLCRSILCVFKKQAHAEPSCAADRAAGHKAGIGVM